MGVNERERERDRERDEESSRRRPSREWCWSLRATFSALLAAFSSLRSALRRFRSAFSAALTAASGLTSASLTDRRGTGIAFVPVPGVLDDPSFLDGPKPLYAGKLNIREKEIGNVSDRQSN